MVWILALQRRVVAACLGLAAIACSDPSASSGAAAADAKTTVDAVAIDTVTAKGSDAGPALCVTVSEPVGGKLLEFGAVPVGKKAGQRVKLANCGTKPLSITTLSLGGAGSPTAGEFAVNLTPLLASGALSGLPVSSVHPIPVEVGGSVELLTVYTPIELSAPPQFDSALLALTVADLAPIAVELRGHGVADACPVAVLKVAEGNEVVPGTVLHLDATASHSPIGVPLGQYLWKIKQPLNSNPSPQPSVTQAKAEVAANVVGEYVVCLEVVDPFGTLSCNKECQSVLALPNQVLHAELAWELPAGATKSDACGKPDLDLQFAHPLANQPDQDCDGKADPWYSIPWTTWWMNPIPNWGPKPDGDADPYLSADGMGLPGLENLNVGALQGTAANPLAYPLGVHYWNDQGCGPALATVRIYMYGTLFAEWNKVLLQPLDMWYIARITQGGVGSTAIESCHQTGLSCPAGKNLMWQPKGDRCVTPCYPAPQEWKSPGGGPAKPKACATGG